MRTADKNVLFHTENALLYDLCQRAIRCSPWLVAVVCWHLATNRPSWERVWHEVHCSLHYSDSGICPQSFSPCRTDRHPIFQNCVAFFHIFLPHHLQPHFWDLRHHAVLTTSVLASAHTTLNSTLLLCNLVFSPKFHWPSDHKGSLVTPSVMMLSRLTQYTLGSSDSSALAQMGIQACIQHVYHRSLSLIHLEIASWS